MCLVVGCRTILPGTGEHTISSGELILLLTFSASASATSPLHLPYHGSDNGPPSTGTPPDRQGRDVPFLDTKNWPRGNVVGRRPTSARLKAVACTICMEMGKSKSVPRGGISRRRHSKPLGCRSPGWPEAESRRVCCGVKSSAGSGRVGVL